MRTQLIALVASVAMATPLLTAEDKQFMEYVVQHGKSYATKEEYEFRSDLFKKTLAKLAEHPENSTSTVGVNFMADWTEAEFK